MKNEASKKLIVRTLRGAHRGWDTFGIEGEGVRFQELHDLLETAPFEAARAEVILSQISSLAKSHGYGTQDGYLNRLGDVAPSALEELFDEADTEQERSRIAGLIADRDYSDGGFEEGDYFSEINASLKALSTATAAAASFMQSAEIFNRLYDAYQAGIDEKNAEIVPAPSM